MKLKYCFAASLLLLLFMRAETIDAQSVVAEHEVELKGVIVDWQDARIINVYVIKKLKVSEAGNAALKVQLKIKPALTSGVKCPKGQLCL